MADLKKKFIDILFEDEIDEDEISEVTSFEEKKMAAVQRAASRPIDDSPIKAKDILYRKSNSSPFVNLNENVKSVYQPKEEYKNEEYEMSSQISPIFGLIRENKTKSSTNIAPEITEAQTNKPSDSHLDIITSPIYGYSTKENAKENDYDVKGIISENEDDELHHLFDEEDTLNASYQNLSDDFNNNNDDEEISLFRLFGDNK